VGDEIIPATVSCQAAPEPAPTGPSPSPDHRAPTAVGAARSDRSDRSDAYASPVVTAVDAGGDLATRIARAALAAPAWERWAECGAMALTGDAAGPPLAPAAPIASVVEAAAIVAGDVAAPAAALIGERAATLGLARRGRISCGGTTRLLPADDGWLAVGLPRPADVASLSAWLGIDGPEGDPWPVVAAALARMPVAEAAARAALLEIPVGVPGEEPAAPTPWSVEPGPPGPAVAAPLVVDLSALWAGPLCADLLRHASAHVVKVEDPARPDMTRHTDPSLFDLLNGGKRSVALDLRSRDGRRDLLRLLRVADAVVSSSRPRAFEQLGIDVGRVLVETPTVWIAITAHGWSGPRSNRVGLGDDAAVAGGLVMRGDAATGPRFVADAVADPLTGVLAAAAGAALLGAGGSWFVDAPLARAAAWTAGLGSHLADRAATWGAGGWELDGAPVRPPRSRTPAGAAPPLGHDTDAVLAEAARRA